ncbi:MAG: NAD(P)-dependent oxidoreductase [Gemmataceae bacterium]
MSTATLRIVIPGDDPPQVQGSPHLDRLRQRGEVVLYTDQPTSVAEQIERAQDAVCLINSRSSLHWPGAVLRQLPQLKMITVCGIGTDAIDLTAARELGITVCNLPGRTAPIVAEHAFGLMLAVAKRAWFQTNELKSDRWTALDNVYLRGKTLGLIGAGPIGREMAHLCRVIGMTVKAWTFHPSEERARSLGVSFVSLEELLDGADVVSLHVPLTEQSRGLIGAREFSRMRPGTILINTARGAVVDTPALVAWLRSDPRNAAGLDVFDVEPLPGDHPLLTCQNVVLTPHNADQTPEGMEMLNAGVVDNVLAFLDGQPRNRVV